MPEYVEFNIQQKCAIKMIQEDLRLIYTIFVNRKSIKSNYVSMLMPYIGVIIDGAENWIESFNNSHKDKIEVPIFTNEERKFYEQMRASIKLWEYSYPEVYSELKKIYNESSIYFGSICLPIARRLKLYDIFGVDIVNNKYCGNTILCAYYAPDYSFDSNGFKYGESVKALSEIGGKYIALFGATQAYTINSNLTFTYHDYGGLVHSPVGNKFSDKFVLFSLLCQINFILICMDRYIVSECPSKLRFAYLQYYYIGKILPQINQRLGMEFTINEQWISALFRNAMAHYKIGVALKDHEVIVDDLFCGLTQKYFGLSYDKLKHIIFGELCSLSNQIEKYLCLS